MSGEKQGPVIKSVYVDYAWGETFAVLYDEAGDRYLLDGRRLRELLEERLKGRRIVATDKPKRSKHVYVTELEPKEYGR